RLEEVEVLGVGLRVHRCDVDVLRGAPAVGGAGGRVEGLLPALPCLSRGGAVAEVDGVEGGDPGVAHACAPACWAPRESRRSVRRATTSMPSRTSPSTGTSPTSWAEPATRTRPTPASRRAETVAPARAS